ncbi:MAG: hypothetical protein U0936_07470 [Planctomycetaceae bacterium]
MAARMNLHSRSNDTNPYAAPETADRSVPAVELPTGSPWTIDGDALLCRGDLSFDWLCFSTGLPVEPDAKVFYMKIFAPSQPRRIVFRLFHSLSIATILMLLVLGRIMQAGPVKIFGVPAFVFVLAHAAIFIIILRRTPSFRFYYRRSREGRRRHLFRRTIPSLAAGMLVLGPTLIVLPQLFAASFGWGIMTVCAAIVAFAGFMMLLPEPRAVSLNNGVYRVTYLAPELLATLRNVSAQR